jgi:hypothetical protein
MKYAYFSRPSQKKYVIKRNYNAYAVGALPFCYRVLHLMSLITRDIDAV